VGYVKLRTYWIDFVGNHNKYPIKSKAQYIVIDSVNGFSDIYEDPHSLIRQAYCLDIDTKEYEKMVDEDIAWLLRNLPPCPQRDRIVGVFKAIEENAKELREQKTSKNIGV